MIAKVELDISKEEGRADQLVESLDENCKREYFDAKSRNEEFLKNQRPLRDELNQLIGEEEMVMQVNEINN